MKRLTAPAILARPGLEVSVNRATELLAAEMGASAPMAKAEWTLTQDARSRDLVELRVSDWAGSVGYRFAPDELANRSHMPYRLH